MTFRFLAFGFRLKYFISALKIEIVSIVFPDFDITKKSGFFICLNFEIKSIGSGFQEKSFF